MIQMSLVTCDEAEKKLCLEIQPEAWTQNPYGMLSGGILTTAVDISMGLLVRFFKKTDTVATVHMNMNYLRPVPFGETIRISVSIDKLGTREVFLSANVASQRTGKTVAIGLGVFV